MKNMTRFLAGILCALAFNTWGATVYNYFSPGGALSGTATSQNVNLAAGSPFIANQLPLANILTCADTQIVFDSAGTLTCSANLVWNTSTQQLVVNAGSNISLTFDTTNVLLISNVPTALNQGIQMVSRNQSTHPFAMTTFEANNDADEGFLAFSTSHEWTTSYFSGGPNGEQVGIDTQALIPFCVGTNATMAFCVDGTNGGFWTNGATGSSKGIGTVNARALYQNGTQLQTVLTGTTGSIGGGALVAGTCTSGTVAITNSTTAMSVSATPVTYPGDGTDWKGYISAAGTATVKVCALVAVTPTATAYNVRVLQ